VPCYKPHKTQPHQVGYAPCQTRNGLTSFRHKSKGPWVWGWSSICQEFHTFPRSNLKRLGKQNCSSSSTLKCANEPSQMIFSFSGGLSGGFPGDIHMYLVGGTPLTRSTCCSLCAAFHVSHFHSHSSLWGIRQLQHAQLLRGNGVLILGFHDFVIGF